MIYTFSKFLPKGEEAECKIKPSSQWNDFLLPNKNNLLTFMEISIFKSTDVKSAKYRNESISSTNNISKVLDGTNLSLNRPKDTESTQPPSLIDIDDDTISKNTIDLDDGEDSRTVISVECEIKQVYSLPTTNCRTFYSLRNCLGLDKLHLSY